MGMTFSPLLNIPVGLKFSSKTQIFPTLVVFFFFFKYTVGEDRACELFQKVAAKDKNLSPKLNISLLWLPSVPFSMATEMMKQ